MLAARISQPKELDNIRKDMQRFCLPCSKERYYEKNRNSPNAGDVFSYVANKSILGQLNGKLDRFAVKAMKHVLAETKSWRSIKFSVTKLKLVQYKNTYLEKVVVKKSISLNPPAKQRKQRKS
jgi:hypothetical protein